MWSRLHHAHASNGAFRGVGGGLGGVPVRALLIVAVSALAAFAQGGLEPIPATRSPQEISLRILHQSLHDAVWGMPALCDIRQTVQLHDHKITGFGKFVRGGQGSGKLRMSLQLPAGSQMNSLLQVSDGELLYAQETIGSVSQRTRVDLGKVRERMVITTNSLNDPVIAMYLAIGGQAEVLRKICQQYEWVQVEEGTLGREPVWWLTGSLAERPPSIHALSELDERLFSNNQSGLLPTEIVAAVGQQEASMPFWLYQVEQSRSSALRTDSGHSADLSVTTEWVDPTPLSPAHLPAHLFESKLTNEHFTEETKLYVPPTTLLAPRATAAR